MSLLKSGSFMGGAGAGIGAAVGSGNLASGLVTGLGSGLIQEGVKKATGNETAGRIAGVGSAMAIGGLTGGAGGAIGGGLGSLGGNLISVFGDIEEEDQDRIGMFPIAAESTASHLFGDAGKASQILNSMREMNRMVNLRSHRGSETKTRIRDLLAGDDVSNSDDRHRNGTANLSVRFA